MTQSMRDKPGNEKEDHDGQRSGFSASRMKKGLVEGLAVLGICGALLGKTGCTYEVPGLNPEEIADGGGADASQRPTPDGGSPDSMDAGHDAGEEDAGGSDAGMPPDAGHPDSGMDAGEEDSGMPDSGMPDAGLDGGLDAGHDGGAPDSGLPDSGVPDSGLPPDAGGIVCASTTTGNFGGSISTISPVTAGQYTFHYDGIDGLGNALITITCTEGTVDSNAPCPVGPETDVARPADGIAPVGRTIRITPASANASSAIVTINVTHP